MKQHFIFSLLWVLFSSVEIYAQQIYLLPKGGISIANIKYIATPYNPYLAQTHNYTPRKSMVGITGGLGVEIGLNHKNTLAIQPEILFVQKGIRFVSSFDGNSDKYKFNYLELPLLFKYSFYLNKWKFFANAGPSLALGINGRHSYKNTGPYPSSASYTITFNGHPEEFEFDAQKRTDFNIHLGAGIGYQIGSVYLWAEGRYIRGENEKSVTFNYTPPPGNYKVYGDWKFYNRVLIIQTGISIPINKTTN